MFTFVETGQHIFAVNENLSVVLCLHNMVLELKFTRFHDQPWGFRLSGGSDFAIPLTVIKVRILSLIGDKLGSMGGLCEGVGAVTVCVCVCVSTCV